MLSPPHPPHTNQRRASCSAGKCYLSFLRVSLEKDWIQRCLRCLMRTLSIRLHLTRCLYKCDSVPFELSARYVLHTLTECLISEAVATKTFCSYTVYNQICQYSLTTHSTVLAKWFRQHFRELCGLSPFCNCSFDRPFREEEGGNKEIEFLGLPQWLAESLILALHTLPLYPVRYANQWVSPSDSVRVIHGSAYVTWGNTQRGMLTSELAPVTESGGGDKTSPWSKKIYN